MQWLLFIRNRHEKHPLKFMLGQSRTLRLTGTIYCIAESGLRPDRSLRMPPMSRGCLQQCSIGCLVISLLQISAWTKRAPAGASHIARNTVGSKVNPPPSSARQKPDGTSQGKFSPLSPGAAPQDPLIVHGGLTLSLRHSTGTVAR